MKFNHLSFPSQDVNATVGFFIKQLGCTAAFQGGHAILKRAGFDIVIEDASDRQTVWPENFHLGFELDSVADVQALYRRFSEEGVVMRTGLIAHERGSRFFCEAPGGLLFEINTRADAAPAYRAGFEQQAAAGK